MKKNRKKFGFTLIELLAVIVILAVISLIIVPVITNIIDGARYGSFKASVNGVLSSAKNYYAGMVLSQSVEGTTIQYQDGNLLTAKGIEYSGALPEKVYIELDENQQIRLYAWDNRGYCATKTFAGPLVYSETGLESDCHLDVPTSPILTGGVDYWVNNQTISIVTESLSNEAIDHYEYYLSTNDSLLIGGVWTSLNSGEKSVFFSGENNGYLYMRAITTFGTAGELSLPERVMTTEHLHTVIINDTTNGTLSVNRNVVKSGEEVSVITNANHYYQLATLTYNGNDFLNSKTFTMPDENVTISGTFEYKSTLITFYRYDSGSEVKATQTLSCGNGDLMFNSGFTKTGYTLYWAETKNGSALYEANYSVNNDWIDNHSSIDLYAIWVPNSYTVTFNANGGSVTPDSKNVTYDSTYGVLPIPTRTGYAFDGWFTATSGGTQVTSDTVVSLLDSQTLYATWHGLPITKTVNASINIGEQTLWSNDMPYAHSYGFSIGTVAGHIYYLNFKVGSYGDSGYGLTWSVGTMGLPNPAGPYGTYFWGGSVANGRFHQNQAFTNLYTETTTTTRSFGFNIYDGSAAQTGVAEGSGYAKLYYFRIYDLTSQFGAGLEPSLSWCDSYLKNGSSWSGTYTP